MRRRHTLWDRVATALVVVLAVVVLAFVMMVLRTTP